MRMRMKKMMKKIAFITGSLVSTTTVAHTGFHNNTIYNDGFHSLSGIDHFLLILIIGLLATAVTYHFYKK